MTRLNRRYRLTLMLTAALMTAGCSSDNDDDSRQSDTPIAFEGSVPNFTRTIFNGLSDLQGSTEGFGVFAYHTGSADYASGAKPDFMYNQQVTYDSGSGKWTYSPLKYWPNGEGVANDETGQGETRQKVSFFAYAPHSTDLNAVLSSPYEPIVSYTWGADKDLLYDNTQRDLTKQAVNGTVKFNFRHALALVEFKVRRKDQYGADITLNTLKIESDANTSGDFNIASATWAAEAGSDAKPLDKSPDLTVTEYEDAKAQLVGSSVMMPGTWNLTYTITYVSGTTKLTPPSDTLSPITMLMGYKYTVVFVIDGNKIESYVLREREAEQW